MNQNIQTILDAAASAGTEFTQLNSQIGQLNDNIVQQDKHIVDLQAQLDALKNAPTPSVASGMTKVLPFLNKRPDWIQPGPLGNSNPNPNDPNGVFIFTPGDAGTWSAKPLYSYNNGFWYIKQKGFESSHHFIYLTQMTFPSQTDIDACNAVEFQFQQSLNGFIYNMAWQVPGHDAGKAGKFWRTFDFTNKKWIATSIASAPWKFGVPVSVAAEFTTDAVKKIVTHVALTIDGVTYYPNIVRPAKAQAESNYVSMGFQLDTLGKIDPATGKADMNYVPPAYKLMTFNMHAVL